MAFDFGPDHQEVRAGAPESPEVLLRRAVEDQKNSNVQLTADLTEINATDPDSCTEAFYRVYGGLNTDEERASCLAAAGEAGIGYDPLALEGAEQLVHLRARPALSGGDSTLSG